MSSRSTATLPVTASALTEGDYELLESSCISRQLAAAAGLFRVDSFEGASMVGRNASADYDYSGIVFPYCWPGSTETREYRLRRDHPHEELRPNGGIKESAKYLSPPGRGSLLYFPPDVAPAWLDDPDMPIVIVEGEKKTLAMWRLAWSEVAGDRPRFLPVGVAGVWNWKGKIGKREQPNGSMRPLKGPISDLQRIIWKDRIVIIIFDSNVHTNDSVRIARDHLAYWLKEWMSTVLFVTLPEIEGINGPDDLMYLKGPQFMLGLIEKAYSGIYPEAKSAREHYALHDWAVMDDLASLMMVDWGWDDDDKQTFMALNNAWGGRRTKTFRTIHLTIFKRLKRLPDDATVSNRKQAERFVRDRIKKLLRTIDSTLSVPLVEIVERGGQINPVTGKHLGTKYRITHLPFLEARREAERLWSDKKVVSPGQAREIAARTVAVKYCLAIEETQEKEQHRAEARRLANDAFALQVSFEKWTEKKAKNLWRKMFDEGYTRAEIQIYFRQLGERITEIGKKNLKKNSAQPQSHESDAVKNRGGVGTVERTHSELYSACPLYDDQSSVDSSHVSSSPIMRRGNKSEFGYCPSCSAEGMRFNPCAQCEEIVR